MGKRGPKPSGKALSGAERQRRYVARLKDGARIDLRGPDGVELGWIAKLPGFDVQALRFLADGTNQPPQDLAVQLLSEAIRAEVKRHGKRRIKR